MSSIAEFGAALRLFGPDLDPPEISRLLGREPDRSARKGGQNIRARPAIAETGVWIIDIPRRRPGDPTAQIAELLDSLTGDLAIWRQVTDRFSCDLFCGLFMEERNEGFSLSPDILSALASRGIELAFDIYAPVEDAR